MGSHVPIRDPALVGNDAEEDVLISELDHVIHSMERGISQIGYENRASPLIIFLLRTVFYGSLLGLYVSFNPEVRWQLSDNKVAIISICALMFVLATYAYDVFRGMLGRRRRLRMFFYQVRAAEETAGSVRSWVDRSNLSSRIKHLLQVRAGYLDDLLSEAKSMVSGGSLWLS